MTITIEIIEINKQLLTGPYSRLTCSGRVLGCLCVVESCGREVTDVVCVVPVAYRGRIPPGNERTPNNNGCELEMFE